MATPPQNIGNDNDNPRPSPAPSPGQFSGLHGLTREELLRDWIHKRIQLANAIRAQHPQIAGFHGGTGINLPQAPASVVQHMALHQGAPMQGALASTAFGIRDSLNQIHDQIQSYFREQQMVASINATAVPTNISQQPLDILRQSLAVQAQARQMHGQSAAMNHYPALARARSQALTAATAQQEHTRPEINELLNNNDGATSASITGKSLQDKIQEKMNQALQKKITQKIQMKLRGLKPEITETQQALAMENLMQELKPQNQQAQVPQELMGRGKQPRYEEIRQMTHSPYNVDAASLSFREHDSVARDFAVRNTQNDAVTTSPNPQQRVRAPLMRDVLMGSQGDTRNKKSIVGTDGKTGGGIARPIVASKKVNKRKRKPKDDRDKDIPSKRLAAEDAKAQEESSAKATAVMVPSIPVANTTPADIIDLCHESDESPEISPPEGKREKEMTVTKCPPPEVTREKDITAEEEAIDVSSKLDSILDSLADENVRSAVIEDKREKQAKRKEMQHKNSPAEGEREKQMTVTKCPPPEVTREIEMTAEEEAIDVSSKLDSILDSLADENIRSAVIEDRENKQAKRKETQQIYENQIKEMESRLGMYTKLEGLAKQIAKDRSENEAKNSRTKSSKSEVALDMIYLSLKNYRMLEDTSDRLLGIGKKN